MDITIHASFLRHADPQPYRVRDSAVRDPAGDLIPIQELRNG
jgi:hypothetical protein